MWVGKFRFIFIPDIHYSPCVLTDFDGAYVDSGYQFLFEVLAKLCSGILTISFWSFTLSTVVTHGPVV